MKFQDVAVQKLIIAVGAVSRTLRTLATRALDRKARQAEQMIRRRPEESYRADTSTAAAITSARASGADEGVVNDLAGWGAGVAACTFGCCTRISPRP